jgi:hypothetical protein
MGKERKEEDEWRKEQEGKKEGKEGHQKEGKGEA